MSTIQAVCLGHPIRLGERAQRTGIDKRPVEGPVVLSAEGLAGDSVCNRKVHGGPDQAVYGFGSVDLDAWSLALGKSVPPGLLGENLVLSGIDSRDVAVGDRFETDTVMLEVTATRMPCSTLSLRMGDPHFARRFLELGQPGFYCRVLRRGDPGGRFCPFHALRRRTGADGGDADRQGQGAEPGGGAALAVDAAQRSRRRRSRSRPSARVTRLCNGQAGMQLLRTAVSCRAGSAGRRSVRGSSPPSGLRPCPWHPCGPRRSGPRGSRHRLP